MSEKRHAAWMFAQGRWSLIEDPTDRLADLESGERAGSSLEEMYPYVFILEATEDVFLELYARKVGKEQPRFPYLLEVAIGPRFERIFVTDFPSLWQLLQQFMILVAASSNADGRFPL